MNSTTRAENAPEQAEVPSDAPCERTPLISGSSRPHRFSWWTHDSHPWFCEMPKYLMMVVAVVVFLGTVRGSILGIHNIMDNTTMVVRDTKIVDLIGKDGIEVAVRGELQMDYEVVEHDLARFLLKQGAKLLDHVVVAPTTMNITRVTFPNDTLPLYEQVTLVDVPQLYLNTSPSAANDLDTIVTLHDYDAYTIARLGELMLAGTPFTLSGTAKISVARGWLKLGSYQITSQQTINQEIDQDDFVDYKLKGMRVFGDKGRLSVDAQVALKTTLVDKLDFPELKWDLFHKKCAADLSSGNSRKILVGQPEGDYVIVGEATSPAFHLTKGENEISVRVDMKEGGEVLEECDEEDEEPETRQLKGLGKFMSGGDEHVVGGSAVEGPELKQRLSTLDKIMTAFINGNSSLYNTHLSPQQPRLPGPLTDTLSHFWALLDSPGLDRKESLLRNISFTHVSIASLSSGAVFIDADVETTILLPQNIQIQTEMLPFEVRGVNDLYYEGELFARAHIQQWHDCESFQGLEGSQTVYNVKVQAKNVPVEVIDSSIFRKVASKLLWAGTVPILFNATVDALVETTVGNLTLEGMNILKETELNK
ncbi:hypothetical protein CJU90_1117 [Yarrowia sp. C11]|nr:hypothetical protein CKK34_2531 [Yarrowia sp. E02]KAG5373419.1 hypothetical protein CJU90_1117 [Yarrowia sp. C11]